MTTTDKLILILKEFKQTNNFSQKSLVIISLHTKAFSAGKHSVYDELRKALIVLTPMCLPADCLAARLHVLLNLDKLRPVCNSCGTYVKWDRNSNQFRNFCSSKCRGADEHVKERTKRTNIARYGGNSPVCSPIVKNKVSATWAAKTPTDVAEIITNRTVTIRDKFGVDNASQSYLIKAQKVQTSLTNHGVQHPMQSSHVIEKVKATWHNKPQITLHHIIANRQSTSLERFGAISASSTDETKNKTKQTMLARYNATNANYIGIDMASYDKLNDPLWCTTMHENNKLPLIAIADLLNVGDSTVGRYMRKHGIDTRTFPTSMGELQISAFLSHHNIEHITCDRKIISPQELDIYIPEHKLAIEYCGLYWHSEQQGKTRSYHANKHKKCADQGIQLLTIYEDEWMNRQQQCKNKILSLLGHQQLSKVYARQCSIVVPSKNQKFQFFELNHIQGDGPGSLTYALQHQNAIIAMMTFIQQSDNQWVLNRYATNRHVPGGFTKLLSHFKKNNNWKTLVSFADLRWSTGHLYETTEWSLHSILGPDYYYSPDSHTRIHKFNYRRKNLPRLLAKFNPALSEWENCKANNILKIWDCGKLRYIQTNKLTNS